MGGPTSTAAPPAAALASAAFASWMIHERVVPEDHVLAAVGRQLVYGGSLDTALLEGELLSVENLWALLSRATGLAIPPPDLLGKKDWPPPPFPITSSRACRAVPAGERPDGVLRLLCGEPVELAALERLATKLGRTFELFVAPEVHIEALRSVLYKRPMPARHAKLWARLVGRAGLRLRVAPRDASLSRSGGGALPGTFGDAAGSGEVDLPREAPAGAQASSEGAKGGAGTAPSAVPVAEGTVPKESSSPEAASASASAPEVLGNAGAVPTNASADSASQAAVSETPSAPSDLAAASVNGETSLAQSADGPDPTTSLTEARAAGPLTVTEKGGASAPRQTLRFPAAVAVPAAADPPVGASAASPPASDPNRVSRSAENESSTPTAVGGATPLLAVMAMEAMNDAHHAVSGTDLPVSDEEEALFVPSAAGGGAVEPETASHAEGTRRPTLSFPLPLVPPPVPVGRAFASLVEAPAPRSAQDPPRDDDEAKAPFDEDSVPASPYALTLDFDAEPPALDEPTAAEEARASAVAWDTFSATEALCRRARDPADPGRTLALRALRRRLNMPPVPAFRRHLVAMLDGHGEDESLEALADLTEIRDRDAVPAIIPLLEADDRKLAGAARSALTLLTLQDFGTKTRKWQVWWEEHRHEPPTAWLFEGLSHKEAPIRLAAAEELRQITGAYFGYHFDLPRRDREDAKQRWQTWWQAMAEHEREEGGG